MTKYIRRRDFLKHSMFTGSLLLGGTALSSGAPLNPIVNNRLKIALNAYSFNQPLTDGEMNIGDVLGFCANNGFEACDLTAYYFPGYPEVPEDEFLYHIKHVAFRLGLEICGTGVRNDFTNPDANERKKNIALVKSWIVAAEKLGAPVIRIFAGPRLQDESDRPQVLEWMIKDIQQCVAFGKSHGVMVCGTEP
jgi:sugar phosphate isomerase/epimerase